MSIENEVIEDLLKRLKGSVDRLVKKRKVTLDEYLEDWEIQDVVEREFLKATQACIDIGARIISQKGFQKVDDYHGIFEVLCQEGLWPSEFTTRMKELVGLRNVLVHEYRHIDPEEVHRHLRESLEVFQEYAQHIVNFLEVERN